MWRVVLSLALCASCDVVWRVDHLADPRDGGPRDAALPDGRPHSGPFAHYKMDSISMDSVVEDAVGTHVAACAPNCPTVIPGRLDTALEFNTAATQTQHLAISATDEFADLTQFSATAWIYLEELTSERCVFSKPYLGNDQNSWQLCINTNGALEFFTFGTGGLMQLDTDNVLSVDLQWHHVAIVYDGATKSVWLDGVLLKALDAPKLSVDGHDVIIAGDIDFMASIPFVTAPFIGGLDDLRFYAYALDPGELGTLAAGGN